MEPENSSGQGLDAELLAANSRSASRARSGELRAARRGSSGSEDANFLEEEPSSLRQAVIQKKRKEKLEGKEKKGGSLAKKGAAPIRTSTSALLRAAWANLITSFGLTLLWINTHVFLGLVVGNNFFCKLGEEWTDRPGVGTSGAAEGELAKKMSGSVGVAEKIGLGCLNLGCIVIILVIVGIVGIILDVVDNPFKLFGALVGWVWDSTAGKVVEFFTGK